MEIFIFDTHLQLSAIIAPYKFTEHHISEGCLFSLEKTYICCRVLEANKSKVLRKANSLKIRIDSVNQILKNKEKVRLTRNINILTRITDRKIPWVDVYQIIKNWVQGPYNSLCHADNRQYFSDLTLSNVKLKGSTHVLLGGGIGKNLEMFFCWEKDNFIMINEFKYRQTWKIWPSSISLSLYTVPLTDTWIGIY